MRKLLLLVIVLLLAFGAYSLATKNNLAPEIPQLVTTITTEDREDLLTPPIKKTLENSYHVFQSFNNCGPASLSMTLSYYDIDISQKELGDQLRPYQIPNGDNDDKSVTLAELAEKSKEFGLVPFHRPNGSIEHIKLFITYDLPVITRTWLKVNEDIGHFRVVKGYDASRQVLIQDDSYEGKNLEFSYTTFDQLWNKFNNEYLVLVPEEKVAIVQRILGEEIDEQKSWQKAAESSRLALEYNPDDIYDRFNLSIALFHLGEFKESVAEFEQVESKLSPRTLWYQIEPIQAYFELGDYDRVFEITDRILSTGNRAFSELYYIRGQIYLKQGKTAQAKAEFEQAVFYNQNYKPASEALDNL